MNDVIHKQMQIDEALEKIFVNRFDLNSEKNKDNPGYQAWGLQAVQVAKALANMFIAIKHPESGRGLRMAKDLTYSLNAYDFWVKNYAVLIPLITVAINAHSNSLTFTIDAATYREYAGYDGLISGSKHAVLEVFSMILYLVGGPLLMEVSSAGLKLDLMPYLVK